MKVNKYVIATAFALGIMSGAGVVYAEETQPQPDAQTANGEQSTTQTTKGVTFDNENKNLQAQMVQYVGKNTSQVETTNIDEAQTAFAKSSILEIGDVNVSINGTALTDEQINGDDPIEAHVGDVITYDVYDIRHTNIINDKFNWNWQRDGDESIGTDNAYTLTEADLGEHYFTTEYDNKDNPDDGYGGYLTLNVKKKADNPDPSIIDFDNVKGSLYINGRFISDDERNNTITVQPGDMIRYDVYDAKGNQINDQLNWYWNWDSAHFDGIESTTNTYTITEEHIGTHVMYLKYASNEELRYSHENRFTFHVAKQDDNKSDTDDKKQTQDDNKSDTVKKDVSSDTKSKEAVRKMTMGNANQSSKNTLSNKQDASPNAQSKSTDTPDTGIETAALPFGMSFLAALGGIFKLRKRY